MGWSLGTKSSNLNRGQFYLDDVFVAEANPGLGTWATRHGQFEAEQLLPGIFHTLRLELSGGSCGDCLVAGGVVLIYGEPTP